MTFKKLAFVFAALTLVLAACSSGSDDSGSSGTAGPTGPGDPVAGAAVYQGTCAGCHGADLKGIDGVGKTLVPNEFVASNSEEDLAAFITTGRSVDDPNNSMGVEMPPKGGNPSLSDQDLRDVAAYLQAQQ